MVWMLVNKLLAWRRKQSFGFLKIVFENEMASEAPEKRQRPGCFPRAEGRIKAGSESVCSGPRWEDCSLHQKWSRAALFWSPYHKVVEIFICHRPAFPHTISSSHSRLFPLISTSRSFTCSTLRGEMKMCDIVCAIFPFALLASEYRRVSVYRVGQ